MGFAHRHRQLGLARLRNMIDKQFLNWSSDNG